MSSHLQLGDIGVDVVLKDIRNVHLSVNPPTGRVRISAPSGTSPDAIRAFAVSKLDWIKKQQHALQNQEREPVREFLERESHYIWGRRYLLAVVESNTAPSVELHHRRMALNMRPGTSVEERRAVVDQWYRDQIKKALPSLLTKWEPLMGVKAEQVFVRRMKTKWGSCNHKARNIRLNTELARKPPECLEYVLVHEMAHLIEPTHNPRFVAVMDQMMPNWQSHRHVLNQLPVPQEMWLC